MMFRNVLLGHNNGQNDKNLRSAMLEIEDTGFTIVTVVQEINSTGYPFQWKIFYRKEG